LMRKMSSNAHLGLINGDEQLENTSTSKRLLSL
jgi:hypothetical protein